jgi:uncharacterized Zn finger protein
VIKIEDERMQSVAHLVEPAKLQARAASIDDYKSGQEIVDAGGVMLELANPLKVTAKVSPPGGNIQHTELASAPDGLQWRCTCPANTFCSHLVATALTVLQNMPKHHSNPKADEQVV